jgi:hypothetical protein
MHIFRNWPRLDGLNFLGVRANSLLIHNVAQVLNLFLSEARLCFTNEKIFSFNHFENKPHMCLMLSFGLREIRMSSKYITTNFLMYGCRIEFITV